MRDLAEVSAGPGRLPLPAVGGILTPAAIELAILAGLPLGALALGAIFSPRLRAGLARAWRPFPEVS